MAPLNGLLRRYSGDRIDYRLALDWPVNDDILLFAQTSTGFKGSGVNPRPTFVWQAVDFGPEKLTAYEVGVKSDLLERKLRLSLSAFYNEYNDIQLTRFNCDFLAPAGTPAGLPCNLVTNAGDAKIKGIEVEGEARPVEGFALDGSLSYLDFDYSSVAPQTRIRPGMVTPYTPKWKGNIGVQYEIPAGGWSITPQLDYVYQSRTFSNAENAATNRIQPYGLLNGRITLRSEDDGWEAALVAPI